MNIEKFKKKKYIKNIFSNNRDNPAFNNRLYETYGIEYEIIKTIAKDNFKKIHTLVEEDGRVFIDKRFRIVNRLGYFILKN